MTDTWNTAAHARVLRFTPYPTTRTPDETEAANRHAIEIHIDRIRSHIRRGNTDPEAIGSPLIEIGYSAAQILDSRGLWDANEMTALLCRKQHDYGHGNIDAFGMIGVAVRCSDKVARYVNLTNKNVAGTAEPLEDALLDMVGYAVIASMLLAGVFHLELAA